MAHDRKKNANMNEPRQDSPDFSRKFLFFEILCVLALAAALLRIVNDDVFITLRYAHNLVRGDGLVYTPGERVMGLTNPLLAILEALLAVPFFGNVLAADYLLQFGLLLGCLYFAARLIQDRLTLAALIPLLFFNPQTVGYLGNEIILLLFLSLAALACLKARRDKMLALCLSAMYLARFDAFLFGGIVTLWWLWKTRPPSRRKIALHFAIWASLPLAWHLYSALYYGSFFSNSVASKLLGFYEGETYIEVLFQIYLVELSRGSGLLTSALTVAGLITLYKRVSLWYVTWFAVFSLLYWILEAPGITRWYFHTWTFVFIFGFAGGLALVARKLFDARPSAYVFAAAVSLLFVAGKMDYSWEKERYNLYSEVAEAVQARSAPGCWLEMNEIGILGYYLPNHPVLDRHFLVSPQGEGDNRFPPIEQLREKHKPHFLLINPYREYTEEEIKNHTGYSHLGTVRTPSQDGRLYIFKREGVTLPSVDTPNLPGGPG